MAEITIKLVFNKETGKKDIYIDLVSDADAMPMEHEQQHKDIVENLLGQGVLKQGEVGDVVVTRGAQNAADSGRTTTEQTPNANNKLDQSE